MKKRYHQVVFAWVFGVLTFLVLVYAFLFSPDELPFYKHRFLSLCSAAFAGCLVFFVSGALTVSGETKVPIFGHLAVRAGGGAAAFVLVFSYWGSDYAPVKVARKTAIVPFIEGEDVHLGDNVYPRRWGYSHNPLHIQVYPQKARGLIYFDKETGKFLAGEDGQTHIGQAFVVHYCDSIRSLDFSGYKSVSAYQGEGDTPKTLRQYMEAGQHERFVKLRGPTFLYTNLDNRGNFYERCAAVAVVRAMDFTIPLAKQGLEFSESEIGSVEFLVECYHGGIRPDQPHNFALLVNGEFHELRTMTCNMREKEVLTVSIPQDDLKYLEENIIGLVVLPWQEELPKSLETERGPVHFRDVGIVNAYFKITGT